MNISQEQLNVNNEGIEELALKRFPIVDTPYGCCGHLHQLKCNKEFSRDGYIVGYKDCLHLTEDQVRSKEIDIKLLKNRVNVLEKILLPHQELTQWIEEEIDNMDKNELLNFKQELYDKVHKINH